MPATKPRARSLQVQRRPARDSRPPERWRSAGRRAGQRRVAELQVFGRQASLKERPRSQRKIMGQCRVLWSTSEGPGVRDQLFDPATHDPLACLGRASRPSESAGEKRVDGGAAAQRVLAHMLVRPVGDVESARAVRERGDPPLSVETDVDVAR